MSPHHFLNKYLRPDRWITKQPLHTLYCFQYTEQFPLQGYKPCMQCAMKTVLGTANSLTSIIWFFSCQIITQRFPACCNLHWNRPLLQQFTLKPPTFTDSKILSLIISPQPVILFKKIFWNRYFPENSEKILRPTFLKWISHG